MIPGSPAKAVVMVVLPGGVCEWSVRASPRPWETEWEKGSKRLASGEEHVEKLCPGTITEFCCAVSGSRLLSSLCKLRFHLHYPPWHWEQKLAAMELSG